MKKAQIICSTEAVVDILLGRQLGQNSKISMTGFAFRSDGHIIIDLEGDDLPDDCENEDTNARIVISKEVIVVDGKPLQIITHSILAR